MGDIEHTSPNSPSKDLVKRPRDISLSPEARTKVETLKNELEPIPGVGISNEVISKNWDVLGNMGFKIVRMPNGLNGLLLASNREVGFYHSGKMYQILPGKVFLFPEEIEGLTCIGDINHSKPSCIIHDTNPWWITLGKAYWHSGRDELVSIPPQTIQEQQEQQRKEKEFAQLAGGIAGVLVVNATNTDKTSYISRSAKGIAGAYVGSKVGESMIDTDSQTLTPMKKKLDPKKIPYWTGDQ